MTEEKKGLILEGGAPLCQSSIPSAAWRCVRGRILLPRIAGKTGCF